jgi:hypothetical protein
MPTALNHAVTAVKLDVYDGAMNVIEGIEALQLLARATDNVSLERELDDLHGVMVRLSARVHKLSLDPPTHHEPPIEVVEE